MVQQGLVCLSATSSNINNINNMYFTALVSYTFTLAGDQVMRQNLISYLDSQAKREGAVLLFTREISSFKSSSNARLVEISLVVNR